MSRWVFITFAPAAVNLGLGVYIWSRNSEARENRLLALGCLGLSVYSFRIFEVFTRPVEVAEVVYRALSFGPLFAGAFLSDFLLTISKRPLSSRRWLGVALLYGPTLFFSVGDAFTGWFFAGFRVTGVGQYLPLSGDLSDLKALFMAFMLLFAILQTVRSLLSAPNPAYRKQLLWSVSGIGAGTLMSLAVIFLPIFSDVGATSHAMIINAAFCTTVIAGTMVYAMARYGLVPSVEELRRREEQLRREQAESLAREAELSRQVLEGQIREERLRHERAEMETQLQHAEMERELQTAHDMQIGLMPKGSPQIEGLDISGRCLTANQVGGDYFQYFQREGWLSICMADVAGHAMEAAIPAVMFSGILKSHVDLGGSLQERFERLNRALCGTLMNRTFVCFVMGELNLGTRTLFLSDSGCPYPYLYRAAGRELAEVPIDAYPLGIRPDTDYLVAETSLGDGDGVILCSDGIMEAANPAGEQFGYERTAETIREVCSEGASAEGTIDRLFEAVNRFRDGEPQADDMTCVVLRVPGCGRQRGVRDG